MGYLFGEILGYGQSLEQSLGGGWTVSSGGGDKREGWREGGDVFEFFGKNNSTLMERKGDLLPPPHLSFVPSYWRLGLYV